MIGRNHSPAFKATVALVAIRSDRTLAGQGRAIGDGDFLEGALDKTGSWSAKR